MQPRKKMSLERHRFSCYSFAQNLGLDPNVADIDDVFPYDIRIRQCRPKPRRVDLPTDSAGDPTFIYVYMYGRHPSFQYTDSFY